ncbi:MAG: ribonuclease R [Alphaproteobacteria bacterium]|nr:ribonuclease R [Alphaproteobacteria bacterium]
MPRRVTNTPPLDKARLLALLAEHPGATKRDLARITGLKGSDRIVLKRLLRELEAEGVIEGKAKRGLTKAGELPEIAVLEVTGTDTDGELLARPLSWESNSEPPPIYVAPPKDGAALSAGHRILGRLERRGESYEAVVVRRLENDTGPERILGVLRATGTGFRVLPVDRKARGEYALDRADAAEAKNNDLVLCEPVGRRSASFPRVRVVERIGSMDSPRTISLIAIHAHGIPTVFPPSVLEEAGAAKPVDPRGRTDLRSIPLVTIDPEDARDHDDAVWAGSDDDAGNKGGHVILVAIADVAHYVTPGSALDKEALKRGNSAYFPDRVVPMLPEELSADLCSLKEGVDRPCLAVRMVFDAHGHKRGHTFLRGVMRSAARLTYARAQAAFDGKPDADMSATVRKTLNDLWAAYKALAIAREKRSPLDLDLPERRIQLGADGHVASIAFRERLESMRLIEECMVLANVAAAEALEKARTPLIYRVHDTPSREKLYAFSDFLRTLNINFAKGQVMQPGTFNRILSQAKGTPHEAVMNDVVLRSQAQAIYDAANIGHFGLNLAKYAHFTSPIRRYADLIVHRALIRGLKLGGGDGLTDREIKQLAEIAQAISVTERRAMAAERDSTDRYVAAFMQDRVGATFEARITGVTKFGLFVRLKESGAEGLLPARSLGAEYFRHDERAQTMRGERTGTTYGLGDAVTVKLMEAAPVTGGMRFELAEGGAIPARIHRPPRPGKADRAREKRRFKPKKR